MGEPLGDDELVIRFGVMAPKDVRRSLDDARDDPEIDAYELSFFGDKGMDQEAIARVAERPNPRMRVTTVRRLREGGHTPYLDEPPEAHIGLRFSQEPPDDEIRKLIDLFDEPEENPHPFR